MLPLLFGATKQGLWSACGSDRDYLNLFQNLSPFFSYTAHATSDQLENRVHSIEEICPEL